MNDIEMHEADSHGDRFRLSPQQRLSWAQQAPRPSLTLAISSQASLDELARYLQLRLAHCVEQHESLRIELQQMEGLTVPLQSVMPVQSSSVHINTTEDHNNPNIIDGPLGIEAMLKTMGDGYYQLKLRLPVLSADRGTLHRLAQALLTPDFAAAPVLPASEDEDNEAMDYSQYASWLYELQSEAEASEGLDYWQQQAADIELDASIPYRDEDGASAEATAEALGLSVVDITPSIARQIRVPSTQKGVVVSTVNPNSDAARKGIRRTTVIISVNRRPINTASDLDNAISAAKRSNREAVLLQVKQGGRDPQFVAVRLNDE